MGTRKSKQNNFVELPLCPASYAEAEKIVHDSFRFLSTESINIEDSLNRILAQDVYADIDLPPFNKSLVDGYAFRSRDANIELQVVDTVPAGKMPKKKIGSGQCSRIMTGAVIPAGADCVAKIEHTEKVSPRSIRIAKKHSNAWIARRGLDFEKGQRVFEKGERILSQHIGMLASVGCLKPVVHRKAKVAIIPTGDELVEISTNPSPPHVRGSNGHQLAAQTVMAGGIPELYPIVRDDEQEIIETVEYASKHCDVLLLTGGASNGDFDFVSNALTDADFTLKFRQISITPGKFTIFGESPDSFCFGLPGRPIATFMMFELLVKPLLYRMSGSRRKPAMINAVLDRGYRRKKTDQQKWLPVAISESGHVNVIGRKSTGFPYPLCEADGLITISAGVGYLNAGTTVCVRLLN